MAMCRLWELVDADTWTFDFMEKHPDMFPWAHFPAALARFQAVMHAALSPEAIRGLLMTADLHGSGHVPYRRFHVRALLSRNTCAAEARLRTEKVICVVGGAAAGKRGLFPA